MKGLWQLFCILFKECIYRIAEVLKGISCVFRTLCKGKRAKLEKYSKNVLIIGNGPSLNEVELEKIVSVCDDVVCVNLFPLRDERFWEIKPKYLCLIDPCYYEEEKEEEIELLFQALEKVDWEMKLLCTQKSKLPISNSKISYEYINSCPFYGHGLRYFRKMLYDNNLANCGQQNVVTAIIYYFVAKYAKTIYLIGTDMTEFRNLYVDINNDVYIENPHCYEKEEVERLYPTYFKRGELYRHLWCYQRTFEQLYYVAEYAKINNVVVKNLSVNSYLDMFDKMEYRNI